ncbi:MAG: tetratricopeptide repeat protein [Deltaproteobacteria bacterium]|nr:tetratricopeptide repeat protein [Deltaproteobacteria bacterium]MBW2395413.1 tetratricopeptide repeat protein [Deltaproteobacteria bacterium]
MAKIPPLTVVFLGTLLSLACTPPEERAEQARAAVGESIARGDREAALEAIGDLRGVAPDTVDAQLEMARLLVQAGNAPEAGWLLDDAARRHPDRADVALALARVSLLLGNPARAREVADAIEPDAEQHLDALVLRAQAELQLGDLERALGTLAEAEERHPDRPEARLARIATLLSEDRKDEARTTIETTRAELAGDAEETVALRRRLDLTLAQLQAEQGETDAALAAIDGLLASEPGDLMAWQALLQVLAKAGRAEEALARVESALAADEPPAELHALAAQMHATLGHDEAAEAALRSYVERSDSPAAYQPLVSFHARRGDAQATLAVLDEALTRYPDEAALRLQRTEALLAAERLGDAREEKRRFEQATFDRDPQIEYLEARLALAEGDAQGAVRRLDQLAPQLDRASTQFWLGRALEESGDLDGARRRYVLAKRRDPGWTAPPAALVALEERRGDWRSVASLARSLVAGAPDEIGAWRALVGALERLGEGEAAEAVARGALERFPDQAEPQLLLAQALRAQGKTDEALAALAEAGRHGSTPQLAAARIRTLGMGGRVEEGLAEARGSVTEYPESPEVHAALASLLFAAGAVEEGAMATDRALALAPDQPAPLRDRCVFRASAGRWLGARDDCTRYLEARPEDAAIAFIRGLALDQLGEAEAAIAAYRRAAALDERDARPHNNLAGLLQARGDLDGALAAAQEAYRLDEANPYIMDTLGALYLEKGLADRAISVLEDAHKGAPDLADAQLHLGLAYLDAGRAADARTLLARVGASESARPELRARAQEALDALP